MLRSAPQAGQNSRSSGARSCALVGEGSQILFQAVEFRIAPHHAILKAILRIALTIKERRAGDRLGHERRFPPPRLTGHCRFESGPWLLMIDEADF